MQLQSFETIVKISQKPFGQATMSNVVMIEHVIDVSERGITDTASSSEHPDNSRVIKPVCIESSWEFER